MKHADSPVYAYLAQPSLLDFKGRLAGVFFISGCNFRCSFCHNAELTEFRPEVIPWAKLEEVCRKFSANWVDGAVISGGEPTLSPALPELIAFFKRFSFRIKLDTNGSRPDVLARVLPELDYVAVDIKCAAEDYPELTGFQSTERIAESLAILKSSSVPYELRTTVVESFHTAKQMQKMLPLIRGARCYALQPFVPRESVLDEKFRKLPRTSERKLQELKIIAESAAEVVVV